MHKKYIVPATLLCDFYKIGHRPQYPVGTEYVYSTWTPRSNKHYPEVEKVICFGTQGMIKALLIDYFNEHFFNRPLLEVISEYTRYLKHCLSIEEPEYLHIQELHELGYLPIEIKALPEGTRVPFRVPMMTVVNTDPRFFWLTNYLETMLSAEGWAAPTAATIADRYRKILDDACIKTGGAAEFVPFQGHDFGMRGMAGIGACMQTGPGHLLSFVGTDTIPAIVYLEWYYNGNIEIELIGCSINATEHSVQCAGSKEGEFDTYKRLINEVYPSGFISIVSDTWDLWHVITDTLPKLKDDIMARDGKVVIRPDSGDPVDIMCGTCQTLGEGTTPEEKGVIELLWDIFGGTVNDADYKGLDSHIGAIYGDSITPDRCKAICHRLEQKGFASTNVVFGIGSYTYQYNTRDTFGFALKSTAVIINGEEHMIFKDPSTDDGTKKSNRGAVAVQEVNGELVCIDELSIYHDEPDHMQVVFRNGDLRIDDTLANIRERLNATR